MSAVLAVLWYQCLRCREQWGEAGTGPVVLLRCAVRGCGGRVARTSFAESDEREADRKLDAWDDADQGR